MTRVKVGGHAQTYEDGYWVDFFDKWRLETLFKYVDWELTEKEYYVKLHSELKKIGATYTTDKVGYWLEFERDEDATMFLLRWS
jgi:hypothetical protein